MISEATGCFISVCDHRNPGKYPVRLPRAAGFLQSRAAPVQPLAAGAVGMRVVHHLMPHTFPLPVHYLSPPPQSCQVRCAARLARSLQDAEADWGQWCFYHLRYNIRTPSLFASYLPPVASWTNGRADAQQVPASEQHITCASSPAISNVGSVLLSIVYFCGQLRHIFGVPVPGLASAVTSARRAGWAHFE